MATKSKVVKKALVKRSAPVKKVAKKAAAKKTAPKKAVAKKAAAKKPAVKKAIKKAAAKKAVSKKPVVKKAAPKKAVAKKAAAKRPVNKKAAKPKTVSAASTPAMAELSEELVEKAANTGKPMLAPGDGANSSSSATEDPVQAFDKNAFNKATTKGDPHSRLHLSSKPKNAIKPSGKKPLWR